MRVDGKGFNALIATFLKPPIYSLSRFIVVSAFLGYWCYDLGDEVSVDINDVRGVALQMFVASLSRRQWDEVDMPVSPE